MGDVEQPNHQVHEEGKRRGEQGRHDAGVIAGCGGLALMIKQGETQKLNLVCLVMKRMAR